MLAFFASTKFPFSLSVSENGDLIMADHLISVSFNYLQAKLISDIKDFLAKARR